MSMCFGNARDDEMYFVLVCPSLGSLRMKIIDRKYCRYEVYSDFCCVNHKN